MMPLLVADVHPRILSEMLGHSSAAIILSIYSHVLSMMQGAAAAAMDRLLGPGSGAGSVADGGVGREGERLLRLGGRRAVGPGRVF